MTELADALTNPRLETKLTRIIQTHHDDPRSNGAQRPSRPVSGLNKNEIWIEFDIDVRISSCDFGSTSNVTPVERTIKTSTN